MSVFRVSIPENRYSLPVRLESDRSVEHFPQGLTTVRHVLHQKGIPPSVDPLQYAKLHGPTVDGDLLDRFGGADGGEQYVAFGLSRLQLRHERRDCCATTWGLPTFGVMPAKNVNPCSVPARAPIRMPFPVR